MTAVRPDSDDFARRGVTRRDVLRAGVAMGLIPALSWLPERMALATTPPLPDIQYDIGAFIAPVQTVNGIPFHFGPVYTLLATATLTRTPTTQDQQLLSAALHTIEANYAFSPAGVFTFVSYGLPYFNRLPTATVAQYMPRLAFDHSRYVLEEAVPGPTDVSPRNPQITKATFNVPVRIERNDLLFTIRSDAQANTTDVVAWLQGSGTLHGASVASPAFNGLLSFTSQRLSFTQPGLPRKVADSARLPFAGSINPTSSMWMGFVDQQVHGSASRGTTVACVGTSAAHLTTAVLGDYFDHASVQHLSHVIDDLPAFYNKGAAHPEPFSERVQYMFRSKKPDGSPGLPFPEDPNDAFGNGGGLGAPRGGTSTQQQSAFLENTFLGPNDQASNFDPAVTDHRKYRVGHVCGLQRSSRAADGSPLHIRMDGPGFSSLDVPDGSQQPTLEFTAFVQTAEFFRQLRVDSASLDYVKAGQQGGTATSVPAGVEAADPDDDGLEPFLTATRRQNFLIPPRRHRAFPLVER